MKEITKILIANRGEIALRILKTCKSLGISTIVIYSESDKLSPYVINSDKAIFIGENNPTKSYLNIKLIIDIAKEHEVDAIHPGYGFLSENSHFAKKCIENNLIFIGPDPKIIEEMGSKSRAKKIMKSIGVPIIEGYNGKNQSIKKLTEESEKIGYPILIKASYGGGGRGMRIINKKNELKSSILGAQREAKNSFGSSELIIEKYIPEGRHIEFQILGDKYGNGVHVFERECTIQRRYQKIIEESPSPIMDNALRLKMGRETLKIIKKLNYDNAGTIEFIYDEKNKKYYFLEVNTRLQVEHPVTEMITGLDLVELQIKISRGERLKIKQEKLKNNGYALECRIYAEDPKNNFLPQSGKIIHFKAPKIKGLRVDSGIESKSEISIHYDPMIAKFIVWAENRENAHIKMKYALENTECLGIKTNLKLLVDILNNKNFKNGSYDIHFLDRLILKNNKNIINEKPLIAAVLFNWIKRNKKRKILKSLPSGWRNNFYKPQTQEINFNDKSIKISYRYTKNNFIFYLPKYNCVVKIIKSKNNSLWIEFDGIQEKFKIFKKNNQFFIYSLKYGNISMQIKDRIPSASTKKTKGSYVSPMPSKIIKLLVKVGQKINANEPLIILSSMKMENTIFSYKSGIVDKIRVKEGQNVEKDTLLLNINEIEK